MPEAAQVFSRHRSIARDLALGLTVIIIQTTLIPAISYQICSNKQLAGDIQAQAEQIFAEAGDIFFFPLDNCNNLTLQHISPVQLDGNGVVSGKTTEVNDLLIDAINGPVEGLMRKDKVLYAKERGKRHIHTLFQ